MSRNLESAGFNRQVNPTVMSPQPPAYRQCLAEAYMPVFRDKNMEIVVEADSERGPGH